VAVPGASEIADNTDQRTIEDNIQGKIPDKVGGDDVDGNWLSNL
jgi:hypothetical protein